MSSDSSIIYVDGEAIDLCCYETMNGDLFDDEVRFVDDIIRGGGEGLELLGRCEGRLFGSGCGEAGVVGLYCPEGDSYAADGDDDPIDDLLSDVPTELLLETFEEDVKDAEAEEEDERLRMDLGHGNEYGKGDGRLYDCLEEGGLGVHLVGKDHRQDDKILKNGRRLEPVPQLWLETVRYEVAEHSDKDRKELAYGDASHDFCFDTR